MYKLPDNSYIDLKKVLRIRHFESTIYLQSTISLDCIGGTAINIDLVSYLTSNCPDYNWAEKNDTKAKNEFEKMFFELLEAWKQESK